MDTSHLLRQRCKLQHGLWHTPAGHRRRVACGYWRRSPVSRRVLLALQGRVRTKTIKRSARVVVEKYYSKLGMDFHTNKRVVDDVAQTPSKRMRNKISGFITVRCLR